MEQRTFANGAPAWTNRLAGLAPESDKAWSEEGGGPEVRAVPKMPERSLSFGRRREILVDGSVRAITPGTPVILNGRVLKEALGIYAGFTMYVQQGSSWSRIGDEDVVVLDDERFQSVDERPKVSSVPRFSTD